MKLFGFDITRAGESKAIRREDILTELSGGGGSSKSGARVTWKTALQVVTAFACARVIADGLAQVPFKLFRDLPAGGKAPAKDHPLYALLTVKPNDLQTSYELREQIALHLVFCGQAFVWKNQAGGKIYELLPFEPNAVSVKRNGWNVSYQITDANGRQYVLAAEDVWHLRGPSWDGFTGLESVRLAREALGLALAAEEHSARMFGNGARVGGILTTEGTPKPEDRTEMRKSWQEQYGGLANAFKTALLWGGLKYQPLGMPSDQAQLIEQRRFQIEEVCRFARVLPIMIGHYDKAATFASAEQMFLAHVVHTLGPWYARFEQSADVNLLTEKERDQGYYFKFLPQGLMRGAHKDRAEYFSRALGAGGGPAWMTQDEVRELDELNPVGGDAARLREPSNIAQPPGPKPVEEDNASKALAAVAELKSIVQTAMADPRQPDIHVKAGDLHLSLPEGMVVNHIDVPKAAAPNIDVHLPAQAAPEIHFTAPDVKVDVAAPIINLEATLPQQEELRMHILSMPTRETDSAIDRDPATGNITKTMQIERDA